MSTWVFIVILVLGAIVTYVGLQVGRLPSEEEAAEEGAAEPATFTSMREPGAEPEAVAPTDPAGAGAARPSLETRLRERADERARVAREPEAPATPDAIDPPAGGAVPARESAPAFELRPLGRERRNGFAERWSKLSPALALSPAAAIADVDALVREVLVERGLPGDPDDPAMAEAALAHADLVDPFRLATTIARSAGEGPSSAGELRQAALHYRNALERLLALGDVPVG